MSFIVIAYLGLIIFASGAVIGNRKRSKPAKRPDWNWWK